MNKIIYLKIRVRSNLFYYSLSLALMIMSFVAVGLSNDIRYWWIALISIVINYITFERFVNSLKRLTDFYEDVLKINGVEYE